MKSWRVGQNCVGINTRFPTVTFDNENKSTPMGTDNPSRAVFCFTSKIIKENAFSPASNLHNMLSK